MQIKIFSLLSLFLVAILLSGCVSNNKKQEEKPSGVAGGLFDVNKKAKEDIAKATEKESAKLNNALNEEKNMSTSKAPVVSEDLIKKYPFAVIKTSLGDIKIKFSGTTVPLTVTNFLQLAENKFYDNVKFHRVIKGFMIQSGDPLSKDSAIKNLWGAGDPGYRFKDELVGTETYPQGTLAMANSGPNTNGSQFFIVTASPTAQLPPSYTVFGEVVSGIDVALKIEDVETIASDRPVEDVTILSIIPLEK